MRGGVPLAATELSIPAALGDKARQKPDTPAYTFIDYELDPEGYSQTLTWSQLHRRARVIAGEIASCTSPGDRVAILAPRAREYIPGIYAARGAGCPAVPFPVPQFGAHDKRA